MLKLTFVILCVVGAAGCWWWLRRRAPRKADPVRTGIRSRLLLPRAGARRPSLQSIAEAAAEQMSAVIMVLERAEEGLRPIACAPWGSDLGPLDALAAGEVFRDGAPAGKGAGRHGMSDWLFVPISRGTDVIAVAAVAGRNNRRSFDPDADRNIVALVDAFQKVLQPRRNSAPPPRPVSLLPSTATRPWQKAKGRALPG